MIWNLHGIIFTLSKQQGWDRRGMWHWWGTEEVHRGFLWETPIKIYYLEDQGIDGRIILKRILKSGLGRMDWIAVAGGRHLWMRQWTIGFNKVRGISWLAEELSATQEGLCSMQLAVTETLLNDQGIYCPERA